VSATPAGRAVVSARPPPSGPWAAPQGVTVGATGIRGRALSAGVRARGKRANQRRRPASSANEPRLRAGGQASGGARLGADATETEVGTEIATDGTTPTTSATTRGDHARLG